MPILLRSLKRSLAVEKAQRATRAKKGHAYNIVVPEKGYFSRSWVLYDLLKTFRLAEAFKLVDKDAHNFTPENLIEDFPSSVDGAES